MRHVSGLYRSEHLWRPSSVRTPLGFHVAAAVTSHPGRPSRSCGLRISSGARRTLRSEHRTSPPVRAGRERSTSSRRSTRSILESCRLYCLCSICAACRLGTLRRRWPPLAQDQRTTPRPARRSGRHVHRRQTPRKDHQPARHRHCPGGRRRLTQDPQSTTLDNYSLSSLSRFPACNRINQRLSFLIVSYIS